MSPHQGMSVGASFASSAIGQSAGQLAPRQPLTDRMRVLILTADTGFGHRTASRAIAAALEQAHGAECECIIRSLTTDRRVPSFVRSSQRNYDNAVRHSRTWYWLTYAASESPPGAPSAASSPPSFTTPIREIVDETQPDAIVSTYHLFNGPINAVLAKIRPRPLFFTVVTDLADVHRLWFQPGSRA